jgi:tungstate transport system substrate-binding protein
MRPLRRGFYVMEVNPNRFPRANYQDAKALADYLVAPATQEAIRMLPTGQPGRPAFFPGNGRREPPS